MIRDADTQFVFKILVRKTILTGILFLVLMLAPLAAPPIYFNRAAAAPVGGIATRIHYFYGGFTSITDPLTLKQADIPADGSGYNSGVTFYMSYGLRENLTLAINTVFVNKKIESLMIKEGSGLGDTYLSAKFQLKRTKDHALSLAFLYRLNTGSFEELEKMELPTGVGSDGFSLRLISDHFTKKRLLITALIYDARFKDLITGAERGDLYRGLISYGDQLFRNYYWELTVQAYIRSKDERLPFTGYGVSGALGVQAVLGRMSLQILAEVYPFKRDLYDDVLQIKAGLSWNISRGKR